MNEEDWMKVREILNTVKTEDGFYSDQREYPDLNAAEWKQIKEILDDNKIDPYRVAVHFLRKGWKQSVEEVESIIALVE